MRYSLPLFALASAVLGAVIPRDGSPDSQLADVLPKPGDEVKQGGPHAEWPTVSHVTLSINYKLIWPLGILL